MPLANPTSSSTQRSPVVYLSTSEGDIAIELYPSDAPKACENFTTLAAQGYYDNTAFHRLVKGRFLQGGDPTGTGTGGMSCFGYLFEDEISTRLKHTGAGIVSCASAGPNSNGSQFFITLGPCEDLDGVATVFGRVAAGMHVLRKISEFSVNKNEEPITAVKVHKATSGGEQVRQPRPLPDSIPPASSAPTTSAARTTPAVLASVLKGGSKGGSTAAPSAKPTSSVSTKRKTGLAMLSEE